MWDALTTVSSLVNHHVMAVNGSKMFAGAMMVLVNVGAKFMTIQFSRSTEEYMKRTISKQVLIFAMSWMGTRDIYAALGITAVFTILSEHLFNEDSSWCIVPPTYRVMDTLLDLNEDGVVTDAEYAAAIAVLEKAKREKQRHAQRQAFQHFQFHKYG